jgi:hypothetical protein
MAFCGRCGARLAALCPSCGYANPEGFAFCGKCGTRVAEAPAPSREGTPDFTSPQSYTPKHLAERILTSKAALEGERKQVTVLFADLKGSMELLADRDPEEARRLLDPVVERMMEGCSAASTRRGAWLTARLNPLRGITGSRPMRGICSATSRVIPTSSTPRAGRLATARR